MTATARDGGPSSGSDRSPRSSERLRRRRQARRHFRILGLAPVDVRRTRALIEHLGSTRRREVVPAPVDERFDAVAHPAHQGSVHTQPGRERDRTVELVAMLADFGHSGATADHRHDALVLVVKRFRWLTGDLGEDAVCDTLTALERHRPELREGIAVGSWDVGDVTDDVYPGNAVHSEVLPDVDAPAPSLRE